MSGKFDDVIQRRFSVIPKITSPNLCKPIHDIIFIIPLPFVLLCMESAERKGKNHKTLNIMRTERAF